VASITVLKDCSTGGLGRIISGLLLRQGTLLLLRSRTHLGLRTSSWTGHQYSIPSRSAQGHGQACLSYQ
jgi:hypothetical protein